ncbi:MAG: putative T7SS-secreted protein [Nocardioides sp.]
MTLPDGAELGTTSDPQALIRGEPAQVETNATRLSDEATRISGLAEDVDAITVTGWSGGFGEPAYQSARSAERAKWQAYADLLEQASTSLSTYAGALRAAQTKAADAIARWEQGEAATAQAVADYNSAVAAYNSYVNRDVCVPSYGGPVTPSVGPARPGPFVDPGVALREEAQQILDEARQALESAGATAVKELGGLEGSKTEGSTHGPTAEGSVEGPSIDWGDWDNTFGRNGAEGPDGKYDKGGSESPFQINLGKVEGKASIWGAEGSWEDYWGGARVHADGSVTVLGVEGGAEASVGSDGVVIGANGKAVLVGVEGSTGAEWEYASIGADGQAYVGGNAEGEVLLGPTGAHAGGEVFLGAKAEGGLEGEVGGVGGDVEGEVWAGFGAAADVDFGFTDGKFEIGGSGGLAFGLGGKVGGHITIDPGEVLDTGGDIINGIGDLLS